LTINYLKPFEPGEPIDINTLNKLIQNVNFLASQIAQIYRLPAVQAPVVTVSGATGSTSGTPNVAGNNGDGSDGSGDQKSKEQISLSITKSADFRKTGQAQSFEVTQAMVENVTKKPVKGFTILTVSIGSLMFHKKNDSSTRYAASGAKMTGVKAAGKVVSYTPNKDTDYKSGVNAPQQINTSPYFRLYFTADIQVEVTY
jgi:nucleoid DNA-binding protein